MTVTVGSRAQSLTWRSLVQKARVSASTACPRRSAVSAGAEPVARWLRRQAHNLEIGKGRQVLAGYGLPRHSRLGRAWSPDEGCRRRAQHELLADHRRGASSEYVRVGDEGSRAEFHFCPTWGSTVYYEPEGLEEFQAIPVGAFADPGFPPPCVCVYESRMHSWVVPPSAPSTFHEDCNRGRSAGCAENVGQACSSSESERHWL
jgi:hypothetical protein